MNLDQSVVFHQTAPKRAVCSGSILFATQSTKVHTRMREQTTIIINVGERVIVYLV